MPNRWNDWFRQAERDLEHANASAEAGRHEWSAAEPAGPRTLQDEAIWVYDRDVETGG
ncbi:MAG: hypothetical protein ABR599_01815 [Gemmatimonadota bacterium]